MRERSIKKKPEYSDVNIYMDWRCNPDLTQEKIDRIAKQMSSNTQHYRLQGGFLLDKVVILNQFQDKKYC